MYIYIPHYNWVYWVYIYLCCSSLKTQLSQLSVSCVGLLFQSLRKQVLDLIVSALTTPKRGIGTIQTWWFSMVSMGIFTTWDPQARTDSVPYHTCDVYFLGISSVEGSSFLSSGASLGHPKLTWKSHYPPLCHQLHAWKIPHLQIVPANESSIFVRDFARLMTPFSCIWFRWGSSDISWLVVKKPSWNIYYMSSSMRRIIHSYYMENKIHVPNHHPISKSSSTWNQWIGLRENLQETIDFPIEYGAFL